MRNFFTTPFVEQLVPKLNSGTLAMIPRNPDVSKNPTASVFTAVYLALTTEAVCSSETLTNVNVKVKVTLEQATNVQRGSRGVVLLFL
jgi:hypothetical protein